MHCKRQCVVLLIFLFGFQASPQADISFRKIITLKNNEVKVEVDLAGGSIVNFSFHDLDVNPLHCFYPQEGDTAPKGYGHFVCFDRRGRPSKNEAKNGMRFHGEGFRVMWNMHEKPNKQIDGIHAKMSCTLPMGKMKLDRHILLEKSRPVFHVTEELINLNPLSRAYNIMQHVSIGPPFLDTLLIINSSADTGFMCGGVDKPVRYLYWPRVLVEGHVINQERMIYEGVRRKGLPFASNEENGYAWMTFCNPSQGLLIGYLWKAAEYPWMFFWRDFKDHKPAAICPEFGTAALGWPFHELHKKGWILKRPLYEYIDAGEMIQKSYTAFIVKIPEDFGGVQSVRYENENICLIEIGEGRKIRVEQEAQ